MGFEATNHFCLDNYESYVVLVGVIVKRWMKSGWRMMSVVSEWTVGFELEENSRDVTSTQIIQQPTCYVENTVHFGHQI